MPNIDHDALFKKLLTNFFGEFLELFLPEVLAYIDRASIMALDKEIFAAIGDEPNLEADVLMKANFKGKETWFIIHVEPQSYTQNTFSRRMFVYFANLYLHYDKPIYPVALFTYNEPFKKAPNRLQVKFPDKVVLDFSFEAIQLNRLDWHDYLNSVNPVALALMAKMNLAPEDYIRVKLECLNKLFGLGLTDAQENIVVEFVDTYIPLNQNQQQLFLRELEDKGLARKERYMTFVNSWKQEGIDLGIEQGKLNLLLQLLTYRFNTLTPEVENQIKALPTEKIDALSRAMFDFKDSQGLLNWLTVNAPAIPPEETGTK